MLSGLASFFFGGNETTTTTSEGTLAMTSPSHLSSASEEEGGSSACCYTTTETEGGDWLMIVEANRRRRSITSTSDEGGDRLIVDPTRDPRVSPVSSAPSSPTPIAYLDGSWYITPPPCFMADSPTNMETSPMENLLIEHPSMSVYVGTTSRLSLGGKRRGGHRSKAAFRRLELVENNAATESFEEVISCDLPSSTEEVVVAPVVVDQTPTSLATTQNCRPGLVHCPRQLSAMAAGANELLLHIENRARAQKALREKQTKFCHHRQLERLNKVQEYQSIGKRQQRKDFMKRHSGANNNRKC